MTLRDSIAQLAPPWLANDSPANANSPIGGVAGRVLYAMGLTCDTLVEKMQEAIYARLPLGGTSALSRGNGGPYADALGLIGADRVIQRGLNESNLHYGTRLQRAFQTWQHAGQAITVMQEVLGYLGTSCKAAVVRGAATDGKASFTIFPASANLDLPPSRMRLTWWWDTNPADVTDKNGGTPHGTVAGRTAWWRDWLVLWSTSPNAWTAAGPNWGDAGVKWGDTTRSWGLSVPPTEIGSVRQLVGQWKCANTWYQWIVVSLVDSFADYSNGGSFYPPDGSWGPWSKVSTATNPDGNTVPAYVPSRSASLRYCSGIATNGNPAPNWPPPSPSGFPYY